MWQRPWVAAGFDAVSRYGSSCTTVRFLRILRGFLVKLARVDKAPGSQNGERIGLRPKCIEDLTKNHRKLLVPKIAEGFGIQNLPMFCCIFAVIPALIPVESFDIWSPRGPFGGYFGRDWKWSSPVARQASRSPQKAHQLPKMMLGFWDIPKMPRYAKAGSIWFTFLCEVALASSSASAQLFVVSWRDTPLFSETTLQKSSETERHIPKPEVIFRNYVGFRNLFLLYWEINTTGSTNTVQQLHATTWFRVYFGLSNQTSNQ